MITSFRSIPNRLDCTNYRLFIGLSLGLLALPCVAEVNTRVVNNGNLVLYDIPETPAATQDELHRFQNVRSASFQSWTADSKSIYISTRFGDIKQLHKVDRAGAARRQLTFFSEPISNISRQPNGDLLSFTMDASGNENSQVFLLDSVSGDHRMISDGTSRNGNPVWRRDGKALAYSSTRRNGASNDLWLTKIDDSNMTEAVNSRMLLEASDGSWWAPGDWSPDGSKLLVQQYISVTDSRIHLLDIKTGQLRLLRGSQQKPSVNYAVAFDKRAKGYYFLTDANNEYAKLAYQRIDQDEHVVISHDINWDVDLVEISSDRERIAFSVNAGGVSEVYLMSANVNKFAKPKDSKRLVFKLTQSGERLVFRASVADAKYEKVSNIPLGSLSSMGFSPDGKQLALSLDTANSPSDAYVLELASNRLRHGDLRRWTTSEVGGLNVQEFISPTLFTYPSFDEAQGAPRKIPAFIFKPTIDPQKPAPVIVYIHGGPESQYRPSFNSTFQLWLAKLGAAVIAPNVRGSAGYGGQYVSLDNGYKREDSVKDIGALLDWIATQADLDQDRVIVIGRSYGGYMSLASAVHYSDRLRGAVDVVGISNFVSFLENTQDYRRDLRRPEYGDERNPEMFKFLQKISPNNNVDKITVPMLVVQGQNDPRVPVTESQQIVSALRQQGNQVWYMNALNEGHKYSKQENRDVYEQAVFMFMQQQFEPN
ncbi:MAG: dipeptidyl aminopeptidase/acylaminoacyl peptidase [Arenicella sp.]